MAANAQVYQSTAIVNATVVTDAEIVVAQLTSVNIDQWARNIRFFINVGFTPGADTTVGVLTVRRDTLTGTAVGATTTIPVTPAAAAQLAAIVVGSEPVGQRTYVVTLTATSASANATVNNVAVVGIVGN